MKNYLFLVLLFTATFSTKAQKKISFTFDDGSLADRPGYAFADWNKQLLGHLEKANVKAVFFVTGGGKTSEKGQYLLQSWSDQGHKIANHTLTHPNYNSDKISFAQFRQEFLRNDSIIRPYKNYVRLFRFPYLKEGNTPNKVAPFRTLLKQHKYRNGYVTIDASDWYIDSRLVKRLQENPTANLEGFKQFYLEHLFERANYYEDLAFKLTGRHISHTLLLHHNLAAALFLDDLIKLFREQGWEVISADKAFKDKIFKQHPKQPGEGLLWALAKQSGKFESVLRYPAEDSKYEKDKMDELGL